MYTFELPQCRVFDSLLAARLHVFFNVKLKAHLADVLSYICPVLVCFDEEIKAGDLFMKRLIPILNH